MRKIKLNNLIDQSVWISDDRISAQVSHACQGIDQIDYHGAQPVSRNAKLLQHPEGVLKFQLSGRDHRVHTFSPTHTSWFPAGIVIHQQYKLNNLLLELSLFRNMLVVHCICKNSSKETDINDLRFQILWNKNSMTTDVHGTRCWQVKNSESDPQVTLRSTDQIEIDEWLNRQGDYQGDFLIPEEWRRRIFKNQSISGMGQLADVREEFMNRSIKLYDADTWIVLGGTGYRREDYADSWQIFSSSFERRESGWLYTPVFSIQFFNERPHPENTEDTAKVNLFQIQTRRYQALESDIPKLHIDGYSALSEFFTMTPAIVESARVQDVGMTRACPGTYYWIWAWDNMVTALAQAHWGDISNLYRMADFIRIHRDIDGAIPGRWSRQLQPMDSRGIGAMDFLFSELIMALYRETADISVIEKNYQVLINAFKIIEKSCDELGFFRSIGMYPDLPHKMGRLPESYVAIDEGAWYGFCRNIEKFAWLLNDITTAGRASDLAVIIQENFETVFWDRNLGFFHDSFNTLTRKAVTSYPLFSLLALESSLCSPLLRKKEKSCGDFIIQNLLTDSGLSLTPIWDMNHKSEPAMSAWYPHWDYVATTVLSIAGASAALLKWLDLANDCYQRLGYCPEFVAISPHSTERWKQHGAAWNLNCAAGWYNALLRTVAGLDFDLGGITCHAAAGLPGFKLDGLSFKGGRWFVNKSGNGKYISELQIDGNTVIGTAKIPTSFYTDGTHRLTICCSEQQPIQPQLVGLNGAELTNIRISDKEIVYYIYGWGLTDVRVLIPNGEVLFLDRKKMSALQDGGEGEFSVQLKLSGEHQLSLIIKQ